MQQSVNHKHVYDNSRHGSATHEHVTLINFSFERHGFELNCLRAFEFDDDFNQQDAGQIQNQRTALDEKDLLIRLRDITKRDSPLTPFMHSMTTAKTLRQRIHVSAHWPLSNIEKAKKRRDRNADNHLLDSFNIQLGS